VTVKWETEPRRPQPIEPMPEDTVPNRGCVGSVLVMLGLWIVAAIIVAWIIRERHLW